MVFAKKSINSTENNVRKCFSNFFGSEYFCFNSHTHTHTHTHIYIYIFFFFYKLHNGILYSFQSGLQKTLTFTTQNTHTFLLGKVKGRTIYSKNLLRVLSLAIILSDEVKIFQ